MLDTNLLQQVDRLPLKDRMILIEYAARSVQTELVGKRVKKRGSSLNRVLGALRVKGKPAPTDEEVKKMVVDHLVEKYS
jgi:hypothetical protein